MSVKPILTFNNMEEKNLYNSAALRIALGNSSTPKQRMPEDIHKQQKYEK